MNPDGKLDPGESKRSTARGTTRDPTSHTAGFTGRSSPTNPTGIQDPADLPGGHDPTSAGRRTSLDRLAGLLLFLPVPIVLWLFVRQPVGTYLSLGLGMALMLSHRYYARPFALERAPRRCLWTGSAAPPRQALLTVEEPVGTTRWNYRDATAEENLLSTFAFAARYSSFLRLGILGALAVFLILTLLSAAGWVSSVSTRDAAAFFQVAVAVTVLPLGWLGPSYRGERPRQIRSPFPIHLQALIGTRAVLWLFRLVGIWWLVAGLVHFLGPVRVF